MDNEACLYSQWFPGSMNDISDSLSRDFHISNSHLANLLLSWFPEQGASNSADPSRHLLLADLSAAQAASEGAVVKGTNAKQVRAWARFQRYLQSIGLSSNPYLDGFTQFQ
jgi:hypothetical protein